MEATYTKSLYTKSLGRKILLMFLIFTAMFSVAALIVQNNINKKLNSVYNLATNVVHEQSKPEQALLLLNQAEDDFQEALLNTDSRKIKSYKDKLSRAFAEIDTLLKERPDTSRFTAGQNIQVKSWYKKKIKLSDKLYPLRHSFDSLLMIYADLHDENTGMENELNSGIVVHKNSTGNNAADTSVKAIVPTKKSLIKRLKEAIVNKNNGYTVEINHLKNTETTDLKTQKILVENKNPYAKKLKKLQLQYKKLLAMQRELNRLNSYINIELEGIISGVKDINYNMALEFKEMALKNYRETTSTLNTFYIIAFFLLLGFAVSLIIFIDRINKAEVRLRKENELLVQTEKHKIDELLRKITRDEDKNSPAKTEELKEIVELAINNNPAFLTKFNEFDTEFSKNLLSIAPNMVASEIEFCALLKLNFDTKEIARYTKSSVRAVEGKKYRIRKKLGIPSDRDINVWMTHI